MKELSIEEKAKRYDEILARAEGTNLPYYKEDIMSKVKEFVDYLIPELAESKDERIIKAIKSAVLQLTDIYLQEKYGLKQSDCIAWLEKQGKPMWTEEDEKMLNHIIGLLEGLPNLHNWLKSLKDRVQPQNKWKPSEEQMEALEDAYLDSISSIQKHSLESLYNELKKL